jgi:hypothetical protein
MGVMVAEISVGVIAALVGTTGATGAIGAAQAARININIQLGTTNRINIVLLLIMTYDMLAR